MEIDVRKSKPPYEVTYTEVAKAAANMKTSTGRSAWKAIGEYQKQQAEGKRPTLIYSPGSGLYSVD
jgi:hypothetical protein